MTKFLGGVVVGVFLGALTLEVLARTHPELLERIERRARRAAERISDLVNARRSHAFKADYTGPASGRKY